MYVFFMLLTFVFVCIIWARVDAANSKINVVADSLDFVHDKKQLAPISITCSSTTPVQKTLTLPKGSSVYNFTMFVKNTVEFTDSSSHNVAFKIGTTESNNDIYNNTSIFSGSSLSAGDYEVDDVNFLFTEDNTINLTVTLAHEVNVPVTFDIYCTLKHLDFGYQFDIYVYIETFGYWLPIKLFLLCLINVCHHFPSI